MKNKLLNKIFVCLAIIGILIPCFIVPVAADAVDRSIVNILPAAEYNARSSDGSYSINTVTSRNYFSNVLNPGFRWQADAYDLSFRGFVFTLFFQGNKAPQSVEFIPYVGGPVYTAQLVTRVGNTFQYRLDLSANINIAAVEIRAVFDGSYTGFFTINSCFGILNDVASVEKSAYQVLRYTEVSGLGESRQVLTSAGSTDLPIYLVSDYESPSSNFYDVYNFGVRNQYLKFDYLEEATILFATTNSDVSVSAYIADDQNLWSGSAIYKTLAVDLSYSFTAKYEYVSGRYYNLYYYTATVDLSGVDLSDKMLNFSFDALPVGDNDTIASVFYLALKPPVEDVPWYQVFYNWIKNLWNGETDELESSISSAANNIILGFTNSMHSLSNGTGAQNNQVSGDVDKLEGGSDQLGQLTQDMQVEKPDISAEDVSVDALIPQAGMNMIAAPILTIWNSPTTAAILVLVMTIVLVSFVFFGKKG